MPEGWTVNEEGNINVDPNISLKIRNEKLLGGILPLGGLGETHGGHKGYGLGLLVELMTGNFSGGVNSDCVRKVPNVEKCCHLFAAIDYGIFGDKKKTEDDFSAYLKRVRESEKAFGCNRIYTHGEKEEENAERVRREGIAINEPTIEEIRKTCEKE